MALEALDVFLRIALAGLAGILAVLVLLAYVRIRSGKLLLVGLAFVVFFVKGAALVAGIFDATAFALFPADVPVLLFDVAAVSLMYAGTVKG